MRDEADQAVAVCDRLRWAVASPFIPITYDDQTREFSTPIFDGGSSSLNFAYCPFCGEQLPTSLRESWFEIAEGFDYPDQVDRASLPPALLDGTWWRLGIDARPTRQGRDSHRLPSASIADVPYDVVDTTTCVQCHLALTQQLPNEWLLEWIELTGKNCGPGFDLLEGADNAPDVADRGVEDPPSQHPVWSEGEAADLVCETLAYALTRDEGVLINYCDKLREFTLVVLDSKGMSNNGIRLSNCPFCGARFPASFRDHWATLSVIGWPAWTTSDGQWWREQDHAYLQMRVQ